MWLHISSENMENPGTNLKIFTVICLSSWRILESETVLQNQISLSNSTSSPYDLYLLRSIGDPSAAALWAFDYRKALSTDRRSMPKEFVRVSISKFRTLFGVHISIIRLTNAKQFRSFTSVYKSRSYKKIAKVVDTGTQGWHYHYTYMCIYLFRNLILSHCLCWICSWLFHQQQP